MYRHFVGIPRAAITSLANLELFMQGIGRRRQTDRRFARKETAKTFCTFLGDKYVLYTPDIHAIMINCHVTVYHYNDTRSTVTR